MNDSPLNKNQVVGETLPESLIFFRFDLYSVLGTGDPTSEQLFVLKAKVIAVKMNDFIA